jgi:hypothetical protein
LRGDGAGFHQSNGRHLETPFSGRATRVVGLGVATEGRNGQAEAEQTAWVTRLWVFQ